VIELAMLELYNRLHLQTFHIKITHGTPDIMNTHNLSRTMRQPSDKFLLELHQ